MVIVRALVWYQHSFDVLLFLAKIVIVLLIICKQLCDCLCSSDGYREECGCDKKGHYCCFYCDSKLRESRRTDELGYTTIEYHSSSEDDAIAENDTTRLLPPIDGASEEFT